MRKTLAFLLIAIICISAIIAVLFINGTVFHKTIVVPDDFSTIQKAIDNASAGDTIFVKKGTYPSDSIVISKSVSLIGEDANETIIQGQYYYHCPYSLWHTIIIEASDVLIYNFTITHCIYAITIDSPNASGIQIIGNSFIGNPTAITASEVSNLLISQNYFSNNRLRASTQIGMFCNDSIISHNVFSGNLKSISLTGENISINDNLFVNNTFGIDISRASTITIFANNFTSNIGYDSDSRDFGCIELAENCNDTVIYENDIIGNTVGVNLRNFLIDSPERTEPVYRGSNNKIFNNNFINNSKNANVEHEWVYANSTSLETYTSGTAIVSWDNGSVGNYWSNYSGSGYYAIDENNVDYYPLTQQVSVEVPAPTPIPTQPNAVLIQPIAVTVAIISVVVSLLLYRRHRKPASLSKKP